MDTLSYPYKPKPWTMLLASLFFAGCFVVGWHVATTNHEPMIVLGTPLSEQEAKMVFGGVAAASAVFVAIGIPAFFAGFFSSHRLTLTAQEISAPKYGFSRRVTVVPLADIKSMTIQTVKKHRFLNIYHSQGKLTITQSFLPNTDAFEQIRSILAARAGKI